VGDGPRDSLVRSTGLYGPVLDERRTGPPLDRTKIRQGFDHGPVHSHGSVRNGLERTIYFKTLGRRSGVDIKQ
jgi:hypothetical protein